MHIFVLLQFFAIWNTLGPMVWTMAHVNHSKQQFLDMLMSSKVKPFYGCETNAYPPDDSLKVSTYRIDLDLQPRDRFVALVTEKKQQLVDLLTYVNKFMASILGEKIYYFLLNHSAQVFQTLPLVYQDEMMGIAEASELTINDITVYNIFYELVNFCVAVVVQDTQGDIYQGRNFDYGLLMGWNTSVHEWTVAEKLRPLIVNLDYTRQNKTLFKSVNFVGYVGVFTGMKPGAFALTVNYRSSSIWYSGIAGLLEWILYGDHNQKWISFLTRDVMEQAKDYEDARRRLQTPRLLAPVYFILSGVEAGQGCIITRFRDEYDLKTLNPSWFLVETNYDHWTSTPFYDKRRYYTETCLKHVGNSVHTKSNGNIELNSFVYSMKNTIYDGVKEIVKFISVENNSLMSSSSRPVSSNDSLSLIYNVLSTRPVLNKLTVYTSLMSAKSGYLSAWLRYCDDPCWPW